MSKDCLRVVDYLKNILDFRFQSKTLGPGFRRDPVSLLKRLELAVIHNFEIIGEANKNIARASPEFNLSK